MLLAQTDEDEEGRGKKKKKRRKSRRKEILKLIKYFTYFNRYIIIIRKHSSKYTFVLIHEYTMCVSSQLKSFAQIHVLILLFPPPNF